jgi:hypothetical protein
LPEDIFNHDVIYFASVLEISDVGDYLQRFLGIELAEYLLEITVVQRYARCNSGINAEHPHLEDPDEQDDDNDDEKETSADVHLDLLDWKAPCGAFHSKSTVGI